MPLTADQIFRYREDGYLVLDGLLGRERVDWAMRMFGELEERCRSRTEPDEHWSLARDDEGRHIPGRLHKIQGVGVVDARAVKLAATPEILDCVESLIGPEIDVFGTKFFPMRGPRATSTSWHQDNHYFGTNSDRVVSCAIYLEASDRANGCLQVVPGSHRTGELVAHTFGSGGLAHGNWAEVDETKAVDVVCSPGTVVLFSANLLHGAHPNLTDGTSYRTAWHYIPGDLALAQFPRGVYRDRHVVRE